MGQKIEKGRGQRAGGCLLDLLEELVPGLLHRGVNFVLLSRKLWLLHFKCGRGIGVNFMLLCWKLWLLHFKCGRRIGQALAKGVGSATAGRPILRCDER